MSDDMPVEGPAEEPVDELIEDDPFADDLIDESDDRPAQSAELDAARWELPGPTGVPAVDDALAPLVELDDLPTGEHVPHYETVHRRLQDALADLDSA